MTAQVYVQASQPISSGAPAYGVPCGASGTVLTSAGVDQPPAFAAATGTPGGLTGAVQYNNAGAFAGTAAGTLNQILKTTALGVPKFVNEFSGARLTSNAIQNIDTTTAAVLFPTEDYDTDAYHSTLSLTSRVTIPVGFDGTFHLAAIVGVIVGVPAMYLRKNGATTIGLVTSLANSAYYAIDTDIQAVAGDYFEVVIQTSGNGNTELTNGAPTFCISRYGGAPAL